MKKKEVAPSIIDNFSDSILEKSQIPSTILSGPSKNLVLIRMVIDLSFCFLKKYRDPFKLFIVLKALQKKKNEITQRRSILKIAKIDGRHYFSPAGFLTGQGWPSQLYYRNFLTLAKEQLSNDLLPTEGLGLVIMAITKKCPLKCEHCYEWDELNKKENIKLKELKAIVRRFQDVNVPQIVFAGGEPLNRIKDLIELLKSTKNNTEFWVSTSGFNLTDQNAILLKNAGLTGVNISLDHHESDLHNKFRGNDNSYSWALNGVVSAHNAKLGVGLDLCPVRDYCTEENLMKYAQLAKKVGASFIQIYEPKAVGHYANKDVLLKDEHKSILEDFFLKMNYDLAYADYPIVTYPDMLFRNSGCTGSGLRYLYVDTDGYMHPCPACRNKSNHVLEGDLDESISKLQNKGCQSYSPSQN